MHTSSLLLLSVVFTSAHFTAAATPLWSGCSTTMRCWCCWHPHNHVRRLSTLLELRTFSTSFNSSLLMSSCAKDKRTHDAISPVCQIYSRKTISTNESFKRNALKDEKWASLQWGKYNGEKQTPKNGSIYTKMKLNPNTVRWSENSAPNPMLNQPSYTPASTGHPFGASRSQPDCLLSKVGICPDPLQIWSDPSVPVTQWGPLG